MRINNGDKIEVETLFAEGKKDKAFKNIRLIRMRCNKYTIEDEIWLNHKLAWYHYKITEDYKMCKHYLNLSKELFKMDNEKRYRMDDYYKWLWLYTEVKKEDLSKDEYCSNFIKLYQYYDTIDNIRFSNGALLNILLRQGDEEKIIEFITEMIIEYGVKNEIVKDMVADCKKFSNNLYIDIISVCNFYSQKENENII